MAVSIVPFGDEHVAGAASLLSARHARHRAGEPLLAPLEDAEGELAALREAGGGWAAVQRGAVLAYLLGDVRDSGPWGRHVWIAGGAHASADPEVARDLYATAAEAWAGEGAYLHLAVVPALPPDLEPWTQLGFGHMHVYALRPSGGEPFTVPDGVVLRDGTREDLERTGALQTLIWEHQQRTPSYTGLPVPDRSRLRAEWDGTLDDPGCIYVVAERDGEIVAHSVLYPSDPDLAYPAGSLYMGATATVPEARGTGLGFAITAEVLDRARDAGYDVVATNWRTTNLEASRFWPRRGWRPTFVRMYRQLGTC